MFNFSQTGLTSLPSNSTTTPFSFHHSAAPGILLLVRLQFIYFHDLFYLLFHDHLSVTIPNVWTEYILSKISSQIRKQNVSTQPRGTPQPQVSCVDEIQTNKHFLKIKQQLSDLFRDE